MLPDACRQSVILVPQPNRVRTTPCYKRTYNFAVSKIGLTLNRPLTIRPGEPLRLRYGLWVHAGVPAVDEVDQHWNDLAGRELPTIERVPAK